MLLNQKNRAMHIETVIAMVASGLGIIFVPKLSPRIKDAVCYLLFSSPKAMRTVGIICRTSNIKSILLAHIIACFKNIEKIYQLGELLLFT